MKLKYAGSRPIISHKGIIFKSGKEDKYIYLADAIEILKALSNDYTDTKQYIYTSQKNKLDDQQMQNLIISYHPNLENFMKKEIALYEQHLNQEIKDIQLKDNLNIIEKDIFIKNLQLMYDYRLQRAKNKIFYHHIIETIVETIHNHNIKKIQTPFSERYWHILHTIEGEISGSKITNFTDLSIEQDSNQLIFQLKIN
jgi:hypothetical protein